MRKIFLFLVVTIFFSACKQATVIEKEQIKKADWLIGNWESKTGYGTLTESWKKINDTTFIGNSFFINLTKDTVHSESIVLTQINDDLIYKTTIIGQNESKAVLFPLNNSTENSLLFENIQQDYPQKIRYTKKSLSSLLIEISGKQNGKESKEEFEMTKK